MTAKSNNKELKKVYDKIFTKGYDQVYTSFLVNNKPTEEVNEVLSSAKWKGKKVLDFGCGTSDFAYRAACEGATVTAVDYSKKAIDQASETYTHENVTFQVGDIDGLTGKYDIIVSIGVLEHMDDPLEVLKIMKKRLTPKGKIIITGPNWSNPRGYVLLTLWHLFKAPITLADLHYFTFKDFEAFAKKTSLKLKWRTFDYSWGHGDVMVADLRKRLPNVLRDAKLPNSALNVKKLVDWLEDHVAQVDNELPHSGALGIYIFNK